MEEKAKRTVIYIDTEDEITDIVNKIKDSKEKIIALVPPKNVGILRSAVNLRILERTSKKSGKQIVLVSNNSALRAMAGASQIPVAKTLQSKPEIPEIDALEIDGEDVIDGEKMPVSEFAGKNSDDKEAEMLSNLDIDDNKTFSKVAPEAARESKKKAAKGFKIPDFNKFRKKIFIFGGLGVFLIIFLVWVLIFAPAAQVIISARTSDVDISNTVSLTANSSSADVEKGRLALTTQTIEKTAEVSFAATGTKEEGEAASGSLTLSQSSESDSISVRSGTAFSAGSCNFVTVENVVIPGARFSGGAVSRPGTANVRVRATQIGEQCNIAAQNYVSSIDGVSARGGQMSGGTKTTKKIVTEADVAAAREKLSSVDSNSVKNELSSKFGSNYYILNDSFASSVGEAESSPAVNAEAANGNATLKATSNYSLSAVLKSDLEKYLTVAAKEKTKDLSNQKVYDTGFDSLKVSDYAGNPQNGATFKLSATAKVGPEIDENALKTSIQGMIFSEVKSTVEKIDGVKNVEINFSYFWVNKVPNNNDKINIEFTVEK
ncbi:MAG: hypothetical protein Q4A27_02795 [bacterium]|nr:hypothetical protein [bacterium]